MQDLKVKIWTLAMISDQHCFTISKVAAEWHEPMVPQNITGYEIIHCLCNNEQINVYGHKN